MTEHTFDNNDDYNRRQIAKHLLTILSSDVEVSPIVIDGAWGTGKTVFCKKFMNEMVEQTSITPVYIDAYHADHVDEPLLTVLAAILELLPEADRTEKIKKIIPAIRYGLKTTLKAAAGHLFKQDADGLLDGFEEELKEASKAAIDLSVEALLKDHIEAKQNLETLRTTLENIASEKPMVIFVDELDRCRPSYAVTMLEIIKHVFDVDNVQFVLINNMTQLRASINHCYGSSVDAQRYLDKFVKFSVTLPSTYQSDHSGYVKSSLSHYVNLLKSKKSLLASGIFEDGYTTIVERLINVHSLSLREIESFVRHIEIYNMVSSGYFSNKHDYLDTGITLISIYLCKFEEDIATDILEKRLDAKKILNLFGLNQLVTLTNAGDRPPPYQLFLSAIISSAKINNDMRHGPSNNFPSVDNWVKQLGFFRSNAGYFDESDVTNTMNYVIRKMRLYC
ncbi:KAP family P-loop NTPase fold protein [Vibrio furnissii]|uniref:KAP family P-loop NTPase fold protein n=1 Tax=Vibrio furnissii TaxID=29494 RepID=UPI003AA8C2EF